MSLEDKILEALKLLGLEVEESRIIAEPFATIFLVLGKEIGPIEHICDEMNINFEVFIWALVDSMLCVNSEEESKRLSTGFLLGVKNEVDDVLKEKSILSIEDDLSIKKWRQLRKYYEQIDGVSEIFIVSKDDGVILDIKKLTNGATDYMKYENITSILDNAICIQAKGDGSYINIYYKGNLVYQLLLQRNLGFWKLRNWENFRTNVRAENPLPFLDKILSTARVVSERGRVLGGGAGFLISDYPDIEPHIAEAQSVDERPHIDSIPIEDLVRLSTGSDGHILINNEGVLQQIRVKLNARGGRLASIRDVCTKTDSLGIVISQDSKISVIKGDIIRDI